MRWNLALYEGREPVNVFAPAEVGGVRFDAWSVTELPDGSVVMGIAATGDSAGRVTGGGLLRMSPDGSRADWLWRPGTSELKAPMGLSPTGAESVLVTDNALHVVTEVSVSGRVVATFGDAGGPGARLWSPAHTVRVPQGVLVADRMNDHVVLFGSGGRLTWSVGREDVPVLDRPPGQNEANSRCETSDQAS
jgi:hypothetical protein